MRKKYQIEADEAEVDMTPMLDIVFIMLIFFIVTTSFVRENGINLDRPSDSPNPDRPDKVVPIVINIDDSNTITIDHLQVDFRQVGAKVEQEKAKNPKAFVIVSTNPNADTNTLIQVVDAAREAGVEKISVATSAITTR